MKDKDIDLYVAEFEENLSKVGWSRTDFGVIQKFQDRLQKWIVSNVLNRDVWPETLEEWMEAAQREVHRSAIKQEKLGNRKNFGMALQEAKWRAALGLSNDGQCSGSGQNCNRNRNKDTPTPMEVDFVSMQGGKQNGPRLQHLTPEECTKLMQEGRCFQCHKQGHQSKECPKKSEQGGRQNPSTAQTATTLATLATPTQGTSEAPLAYSEDQVAGLIRAMTMEQRKGLLGKIASKGKGKANKVVDDRKPEFEDSKEDF